MPTRNQLISTKLDNDYLLHKTTQAGAIKPDRDQLWAGWNRGGEKQARVEAYFGTPQKRDKRVILTSLGVMGRYAWPIHEYLNTTPTLPNVSQLKLAKRVFEKLKFFEDGVEWIESIGATSAEVRLRGLFGRAQREFPPPELADSIAKSILLAAAEDDDRFNSPSLIAKLAEPEILTPGEAFLALSTELNAEAPPERVLHTYVHPDLDDLRNVYTSSTLPTVAEALKRLASTKASGVPVLITGPKHSGKTSVLISLLQQLSNLSSGTKLKLEDSAGGLLLPVCAISTQFQDYEHVLADVYKFLVLGIPKSEFSDEKILREVSGLSQSFMMNEIRAHAKTPALYVFKTHSLYAPHTTDHLIRSDEIRRLVDVLLKASPQTRVIANALIPKSNEAIVERTFEKIIEVEVNAPTLGDIADFLRDPGILGLARKLDNALKTEFSGSDFDDYRKIQFPGDLLQTVIAELTLTERVSPDLASQIRKVVESERQTIPDGTPVPVKRHASRRAFLARFYLKLREHLSPIDHRIILLLLSSEDGLLSKSIETLLKRWEDQCPSPNKDCGVDDIDIKKHVDLLSKRVRGRFVKTMNKTRMTDAELFDEELDDIEKQGEFRSYALDPPVQATLRQVVRTRFHDEFSIALMLTAGLARDRAAVHKRNISWIYGSKTSDLRRDVQAIKCALLALNFDTTNSSGPRIREDLFFGDRVFSIAAMKYPVSVFRYLYFNIFRNEVDPNNRLSMVLDNDSLRLDLLLLFWRGNEGTLEGRPKNRSLGPDIPGHILCSLSKPEIADLLLSIAISAHHACEPTLTINARQKILNLHNPNGLDSSNDHTYGSFVRAKCFEADDAILGLSPNLDGLTNDQSNYGKSHTNLKAVRDDLIYLEGRCAKNFGSKGHMWRAKQRLLTRIAELDLLISGADSEYRKYCQQMFHAIYKASAESGQPRIFGGRSASVAATLLIGEEFFYGPAEERWGKNDGFVDDFVDMCIVSIRSRLSEYGESERLELVVTSAWNYRKRGDWKRALSRARQAAESLDFIEVGPSTRAIVLWTYIQLNFIYACVKARSKRQHFSIAFDAAERLYTVAKQSEMEMYKANASLMMTACRIECLNRGFTLTNAEKRSLAFVREKTKAVENFAAEAGRKPMRLRSKSLLKGLDVHMQA